jgi:hypothetical protein
MSEIKNKIVPPVLNHKHEIKYSEKPSNFSVLTIWETPDKLSFAVQQLEDAKRKYCIEHHLPNDGKVRVWTKRFTGLNWGG